MSIFRRKKQTDAETESLKSFLDMIAPSIVKFETGYYICGNTFRCIWALREYPTSTDDLAILRHLGEKHGVTLHIYTRMVSPLEERKIVHNAEIRNRMNRGSAQDMQRAVEAESNLQDRFCIRGLGVYELCLYPIKAFFDCEAPPGDVF